MRNIFLDCGAWNGVSVDFFRENYPGGKDFEIYSFEPLPENFNKLKLKDTIPYQVAVWTSVGTKRFYTGLTESGTLYKEKTTGGVNPNVYIEVSTIDIADFIETEFDKDDYIIMKMNVEGAEYEIIPYMKERGILDWVDKWYVQWHWAKIGMHEIDHDKIRGMIKSEPWLAMWGIKGLK